MIWRWGSRMLEHPSGSAIAESSLRSRASSAHSPMPRTPVNRLRLARFRGLGQSPSSQSSSTHLHFYTAKTLSPSTPSALLHGQIPLSFYTFYTSTRLNSSLLLHVLHFYMAKFLRRLHRPCTLLHPDQSVLEQGFLAHFQPLLTLTRKPCFSESQFVQT